LAEQPEDGQELWLALAFPDLVDHLAGP
jgi:hypothetical protein